MSTANLPRWDPYYAKITPFDPLKTPFDYQEGVTVFDDEEESCPYFTRLKKWQLMYDREMGSETGTDQEGLPEMSPELKESYPGYPLCCIFDETTGKTLVVTDKNPAAEFEHAGENAKKMFKGFMDEAGDNIDGCTKGLLTYLFETDVTKKSVIPSNYGSHISDFGKDFAIRLAREGGPASKEAVTDRQKADFVLTNQLTRELIYRDVMNSDRYLTKPMNPARQEQIRAVCQQGYRMLGLVQNGIPHSNLYIKGVSTTKPKGPRKNQENLTFGAKYARGSSDLYSRDNLSAYAVENVNVPPNAVTYPCTDWFVVVGGLGSSEIGVSGNVCLDDAQRKVKNSDYSKRAQKRKEEYSSRNGDHKKGGGLAKGGSNEAKELKQYVKKVTHDDREEGARGNVTYRMSMHTRNNSGVSHLATLCALKGVVLLVNTIVKEYQDYFKDHNSKDYVDKSVFGCDDGAYHEFLIKKLGETMFKTLRADPDWMQDYCVFLNGIKVKQSLAVFKRRFFDTFYAAALALSGGDPSKSGDLEILLDSLQGEITTAVGTSKRPRTLNIFPPIDPKKAGLWKKATNRTEESANLAIFKTVAKCAIANETLEQFESSETRWKVPYTLAEVPCTPTIKQLSTKVGIKTKFSVDVCDNDTNSICPMLDIYTANQDGGSHTTSQEFVSMWKREVEESDKDALGVLMDLLSGEVHDPSTIYQLLIGKFQHCDVADAMKAMKIEMPAQRKRKRDYEHAQEKIESGDVTYTRVSGDGEIGEQENTKKKKTEATDEEIGKEMEGTEEEIEEGIEENDD